MKLYKEVFMSLLARLWLYASYGRKQTAKLIDACFSYDREPLSSQHVLLIITSLAAAFSAPLLFMVNGPLWAQLLVSLGLILIATPPGLDLLWPEAVMIPGQLVWSLHQSSNVLNKEKLERMAGVLLEGEPEALEVAATLIADGSFEGTIEELCETAKLV